MNIISRYLSACVESLRSLPVEKIITGSSAEKTKPKEIKPKEIKPKEIKPKEIKPKEIKPKEIRHGTIVRIPAGAKRSEIKDKPKKKVSGPMLRRGWEVNVIRSQRSHVDNRVFVDYYIYSYFDENNVEYRKSFETLRGVAVVAPKHGISSEISDMCVQWR